MKRSTLIATLVVCAITGALWYVYADESMHHGTMMGGGMKGGGMMTGTDTKTSMMGPCMGMGTGMGMGMMMPRQVVPVDDGIIVLIGNKLVKYDKDLNKKKEVTLEIDSAAIKSMVQHMQQMHSMYSTTDKNMNKKEKDAKKK